MVSQYAGDHPPAYGIAADTAGIELVPGDQAVLLAEPARQLACRNWSWHPFMLCECTSVWPPADFRSTT